MLFLAIEKLVEGNEELTMRRIACRAGVAEATVYEYFGTLAALLAGWEEWMYEAPLVSLGYLLRRWERADVSDHVLVERAVAELLSQLGCRIRLVAKMTGGEVPTYSRNQVRRLQEDEAIRWLTSFIAARRGIERARVGPVATIVIQTLLRFASHAAYAAPHRLESGPHRLELTRFVHCCLRMLTVGVGTRASVD